MIASGHDRFYRGFIIGLALSAIVWLLILTVLL